jgi:hypothetical protein
MWVRGDVDIASKKGVAPQGVTNVNTSKKPDKNPSNVFP